MKAFSVLGAAVLLGLASAGLAGCGYHVGGVKPAALSRMDSFCVEMFSNTSTQPQVSMQLTSALTDALQSDGTYRLVRRGAADFVVSGQVVSITPVSLTTDWRDTYRSSEIGLLLKVRYVVRDGKSGEELTSGVFTTESSYFNQDGVNVQNARINALSYAARQAADEIAARLTSP